MSAQHEQGYGHTHRAAGVHTMFRTDGDVLAGTLYALKHATVGDTTVRPGDIVKWRPSARQRDDRDGDGDGDAVSYGRISTIFCAHFGGASGGASGGARGGTSGGTSGAGTNRAGRSATFVHINLAKPCELVDSNTLMLQHQRCFTVPLRRLIGRSRKSAPWVAEKGAWREPKPRSAAYIPPRAGDTEEDWDADPFPCTSCDSCVCRAEDRALRTPVFLPDFAFEYGGETFHPGDAAFFATDARSVWSIGLIVAQSPAGLPTRARVLTEHADPARVAVRPCARVVPRKGKYTSERHIYMTNATEAWYVSDIVGKAYLNIPGHPLSLECTKRLPRTMPRTAVVTSDMLRPLARDEIPVCRECKTKLEDEDAAALRLPSTDLYAGGGGSVLGVSRHFEPTHAVDTDSACVKTLKANRELFPSLVVHQRAVSQLGRRGPQRGDAALVVAGPPCQGHSFANHHRSESDVRNDEIGVTVDTITRLRPPVAIIENVLGIKADNGERNYWRETAALLLARGYQVRVGVLNAADYGSPQNRHRFIFLTALRGVPLPPFPHPTHANSCLKHTVITVDGIKQKFKLFAGHGSAPFPAIDAKAGINDLGAWWYFLGPKHALLTRREQRASNNPYHPERHVVGRRSVPYAHQPATDYQRRMRIGAGDLVYDHVTGRRSHAEGKLMYSAPRADTEENQGKGRRTLPHGQAYTLLTSSRPNGKATAPVHWGCHRTFTVAEGKRLQGFRDTYVLKGNIKDKERMIGNAINVDLADALARSVKEAVFVPIWREQGKPSSAAFWSWWKVAPFSV